MNFNSLTGLDLRGLLIDEEDVEYLQNWKLPYLQRMDISENSFKSDTGMKWINKENMPNLNFLAISKFLLIQTLTSLTLPSLNT